MVSEAFESTTAWVTKRVEDMKLLCKEDQDFVDSLEDVVLTPEDLHDQEDKGMQELKDDILHVQVSSMLTLIATSNIVKSDAFL